MGVYIKGMEMPTSCSDCPMLDWDLDYIKCKVTGRHFKVKEEPFRARRVDDCPLVPVPPHGRLIDADALLERFEKEEKAADEHGRDFSFSFKSGGENCTEWWPVQQMLMDAATIIPAEEGET